MSVRRTASLALLLVAARSDPARAQDTLYYGVEQGAVLFTNTPDPAAGRTVPGAPRPAPAPAAPAPRGTIYDPLIERFAREQGVPADLVRAVAAVESGFDPRAVSPKGASGLMQLMPETARAYGVKDVFDPWQNLQAGTRHLRSQLDAFDGDVALALAAYNAGEAAVRRHQGIPNYPETREYVRRVHERLGRSVPQGLRGGGGTRGEALPPPEPPAAPVRLVRMGDGTLLLQN